MVNAGGKGGLGMDEMGRGYSMVPVGKGEQKRERGKTGNLRNT
jgi:hypothetical protein